MFGAHANWSRVLEHTTNYCVCLRSKWLCLGARAGWLCMRFGAHTQMMLRMPNDHVLGQKVFLRGKPKNWTPKVFWAKGFGLRGNQNHLNWTPKAFWAKGFWFKGKPKTTTNCNQNLCFWWPLTQILAHALFCPLYLNPKIWLNQAWLV